MAASSAWRLRNSSGSACAGSAQGALGPASSRDEAKIIAGSQQRRG